LKKTCPLFLEWLTALALATSAAEAGSVSVTWSPNPEADIAGYVISYGLTSGSYDATVDVGVVTSWTVSDLVDGQRYYFAVQAYNQAGLLSVYSDEVSGTVGGSSGGGENFTSSLAEGATGPFFDLDIALANPNSVAAPVTLTFLREGGASVTQSETLAAYSRRTVRVNDVPGLASGAVSTVVGSAGALPIIAERTMFWDRASHYSGHGGIGIPSARSRWYFAEGSQGFFDTYLLIANANTSAITATVTFLLESGAQVVKSYAIGANARQTVHAGSIPELAGKSFSMVIDATAPVSAERAMYFGAARFWDGGHDSAGVADPSTTWYHSEGATGPYFDTYILVANPNSQDVTVTFRYLLESGTAIAKDHVVRANSRLTVNVEAEDPLLANAAMSTTVTAPLPIVSERSMYWPGAFASWHEAHNSFGVTQTGTRWGLAEGRVGSAEGFETFILLANPGGSSADVRVTFMRQDGSTVVKTYIVGPTSRFNVHVNAMVPEIVSDFGALVESTNGIPIIVERSLYWSALGVVWAGGTNVAAMRIE